MRTLLLTLIALIAFAANSVLARLGLTVGEIGPWSFTLIRLVSGAVMLAILVSPNKNMLQSAKHGSWAGAGALVIYAAFFSYAYLSLPAGTGALILFALVQVTMVGAGLFLGERLSALQWLGSLLAMGGLVYLLTPNLAPPDPIGALAMAVAGMGWGVYSLLGRKAAAATSTEKTAGNFLRAALVALILSLPLFFIWPEARPAMKGIGFAVASGAITSGLGYAIWYAALKSLPATRAAIAQLSVPPLAALGGILFLSEAISLRFVIATGIIFTGIALATLLPQKHSS